MTTQTMHKELLARLQQLDLSRYEAEVFVALSELGPSNAGPVIDRVGLHRQFVYSALTRLEERGLVSHVIRNSRRVFQAEHPRRLMDLQRKREEVAEALIPQILALGSQGEDRLSVRTLRGVNEFRKNLITTLEECARGDKILRVFGGGSDEQFYDTIGDFYDTYRKTGERLGVRKHLLAPMHLADKFKDVFAHETGSRLRLSPNLASPTYIRITPELITIEVYSRDPMIIQIWNLSIAQAHKEHFEMLWHKAEPYVTSGGSHRK